MKKSFSILLAVYALVALSVACNKANPMDNGSDAQSTTDPAVGMVTISATLSDAGTRVSFDPAFDNITNKPTGMAHTWEAGDQLRVFDASDHTVFEDYTLDQACVGSATGTFTGPSLSASSYDVTALPAGGPFTSGNMQIQACDGDTGHLEFIAGATGVTDLTNITLNETSSIIGIIAKLPQGAAAGIDELVIETSTDGFATPPTTLTVQITTVGDTDNDDILKVYANVPAGWSLASGTEMFLRFNAPNTSHTTYTRYQVFSSALTSIPGKFNYIKMNCEHIDQYAGGSDAGTQAAPYLIADKYQMKAMRSLMPENTTKYFSLLADIDLENEAWTPLNYDGSFTRGIVFDGNGHTVKNLKSTSAQGYPSFVGVLNGTIKNLTFDGATITGGNNVAGVLAGYVGSTSASITGNISGITVKNSTVTGSKRYLGGLAGIFNKVSETVENCHVINTTVTSTSDRVGGLVGQTEKDILTKDCTAEGVTVSGTINIGGLVGVGYGNFTDCSSTGTVSSSNTENNKDIALGGLVGYFENGTISHCHSSVNINQTTNGRDIGGLIGTMLSSNVEKSYSTGNVKGIQRNVGGFIGLITMKSGQAVVSDCYCTGNVVANSYSGGFIGLYEKGVVYINRCYATGTVEGNFAMGGMIGVTTAQGIQMKRSVAWNSSVTASNVGSGNWSSGAIIGVTYPIITLSDNYRRRSMSLTAWWVPDPDYDHPNVSISSPLVIKDISTGVLRPTTATGTGSGNDNYPQFAYHGKHVDDGTTLSELASDILGWDGFVWRFSGDLPTLF